MKKLLTLLICLLAFISCKESKSSVVLSDEDNAIATLQLYQNVSPELIEERNKLYQLMLKHSTPPEKPSEEDKAYFLNNIAHIDSVVNRGVALIKEQKGEELLTLLEAEENTKAVVVGKMLCEEMPKDNVVGEIIANLLLSKAYDRIGEKELRDNCVRSVMHHPEFIAVFVEVNETIGLPEELKHLQ